MIRKRLVWETKWEMWLKGKEYARKLKAILRKMIPIFFQLTTKWTKIHVNLKFTKLSLVFKTKSQLVASMIVNIYIYILAH